MGKTLSATRIHEIAEEAKKMPDVIEGMTCAENGAKYHAYVALLCKEIGAKVFVELGAYIGETSKYVAKLNPECQVIAIDVNPAFLGELRRDPTFNNIVGVNQNAVDDIYTGEVDVLFIDADHNWSLTMHEYKVWEPRVRKGGLILMDDWHLDKEMEKVQHTMKHIGKKYEDIKGIHATGFAVETK